LGVVKDDGDVVRPLSRKACGARRRVVLELLSDPPDALFDLLADDLARPVVEDERHRRRGYARPLGDILDGRLLLHCALAERRGAPTTWLTRRRSKGEAKARAGCSKHPRDRGK